MKILENELLIKYDEVKRELITYRLIEGSDEKMVVTSYPLEELKSKNIGESGRIIGEDILLLLTGTREEFDKA